MCISLILLDLQVTEYQNFPISLSMQPEFRDKNSFMFKSDLNRNHTQGKMSFPAARRMALLAQGNVVFSLILTQHNLTKSRKAI